MTLNQVGIPLGERSMKAQAELFQRFPPPPAGISLPGYTALGKLTLTGLSEVGRELAARRRRGCPFR